MSAIIIARTITISRDDSGSIRAIKGDMWQTTDDAGNAITPKHRGTKTSFTPNELDGLFPQSNLAKQIAELIAERDALRDIVEPLKEQIRVLRGVPKFNAADLLKQITDAEKEHITQFVANDDTLRRLWAAFLTRVTGAPIPIDSQTFLAALAGLNAALGAERVAELFAAINIDIETGSYIEPTENFYHATRD